MISEMEYAKYVESCATNKSRFLVLLGECIDDDDFVYELMDLFATDRDDDARILSFTRLILNRLDVMADDLALEYSKCK